MFGEQLFDVTPAIAPVGLPFFQIGRQLSGAGQCNNGPEFGGLADDSS
ncbi:hypothetical protein RG47T_4259 [Mucilaginibacter polytrichastri]|uniref:Uncharacterized protein n=1 Tax=Mucilaginibacter polytrichastri TaxID=1302689 RepID=A0A1Q6A444_9SPHI|nr:hypothetical protein RG47T_4259 [Mucilaginibacter polytrichastri]